jgi:hypothetical protein
VWWWALLGCGGADDGLVERPHTGVESADSATNTGLSCRDEEWLAGAYWATLGTLNPADPGWSATSLALDAAGVPLVLVQEPSAASVRRGTALEPVLRWDAATGSVLAVVDDVTWIGGARRGRPAVAWSDGGPLSALELEPASGAVTAGPVVVGDEWWFAGWTAGAGGAPELAVWAVGGDAARRVFTDAPLPVDDVDGRVEAGWLGLLPDGRVGLGVGVAPGAGGGAARLLAHDGSTFRGVAELPADPAVGVFVGVEPSGTGWEVGWRGLGTPGWRVYGGPVGDPLAAQVDGDDTGVLSVVRAHPSGARFAAGSRTAAGEEHPAPFVRLGATDGRWSTSLDARAPFPGWIQDLAVDPNGCVWALCLYASDGVDASDIVLVSLECRV